MRYSSSIAGCFTQALIPRHLGAVVLLTLLLCGVTVASSPAGDDYKKLIRKAGELSRAGLLLEAEAFLRKAVDAAPTRSEPKLELAYVLSKQRRLRDAYDICFPIAQAEPKNSHAFAVLGVTLVTGGRFVDARKILYNAIKLDKREHLAWAAIGLLDFYENRINSSLDNLKEAILYEPGDPDYLFALAQVSARDERYQEAAEAYDEFLRVSRSTDKDRRDRIRGLINFLRFLGRNPGLYRAAGAESTNVPFELVGNRPIITLRINGKPDPLRFVLDTGSGITVLSEETAKRIKVKPVTRGGYARGIGGNGKFEIVYGFLKQVDVGEVTMKDVPIYIRKLHQDGAPVDGYIGLALISKFLTTIDYGSNTFTLRKREGDANATRENPDMTLPLRLTSSGFLSGEVQLEGVESPLNFIVDTGASVSVISDRIAKEEQVSRYANDERLRVIGSAGITDDVQTFLLPKVTFGTNSRKSITAIALDLDLINEASGFEQSGILGGNFLKNYKLTFDFKRARVTFVSVNPEKE
jgi:predicted aspartyl protease/Flp pilus assembly protein TadD